MNPNYSYQTSLPPYLEAPQSKQIQMQRIVAIVALGASCIKEIAKKTGIPDSTVSGRCSDAIKAGAIKYDGFIIFENRKRKRIILNK